jgi:hypothetical protein
MYQGRAGLRLEAPLHFIGDVPWTYPERPIAQERFEPLSLSKVSVGLVGPKLLGSLAAFGIERLTDIAATNGRLASLSDEGHQLLRLSFRPMMIVAHSSIPPV